MVKLRITTDTVIQENTGGTAAGFCIDDDRIKGFLVGNAMDLVYGTINLCLDVFDSLDDPAMKKAFVMTLMQELNMAKLEDYQIIGRLVEKLAEKRQEATA